MGDRILYPGRGVTYGEIWFAEAVPSRLADIVLARQSLIPVDSKRCKPFWTIEIDLNEPDAMLLERMDKNTRYEIRRAESRDALDSMLWMHPESTDCAAFLDFYNATASQAGREAVRDKVLERYLRADMLGLSCARQCGRTLAWHAYILAQGRARLWLSATTGEGDRALTGRANRLLHWRDMTGMRSAGISVYDLGGWYDGMADKKLLSINQFKEQFGGVRVRHYDCTVPQTLRGAFYCWVQAIRERLKP